MLLFRSLSVGLLGAVLYLVATPPDRADADRERAAELAGRAQHLADLVRLLRTETPAHPDVTIVDVAHGVDPTTIASLVRVDRAESIVAVDGRAVDGNVAAGAAIAAQARGARHYIDVEVATPRDLRRVLVLLH